MYSPYTFFGSSLRFLFLPCMTMVMRIPTMTTIAMIGIIAKSSSGASSTVLTAANPSLFGSFFSSLALKRMDFLLRFLPVG